MLPSQQHMLAAAAAIDGSFVDSSLNSGARPQPGVSGMSQQGDAGNK